MLVDTPARVEFRPSPLCTPCGFLCSSSCWETWCRATSASVPRKLRGYISVLRQTTAAWNFWSPGERSVFLLRQLTYVRHFRCRRFAMAKKIPAQAFYEEYHGHRVEHLRDLVTLSEQNECRGALHPECPLTKSFP